MGGWRKLLAQMVADRDPRSYSYEDAAGILLQLGFSPPTKTSGSHRKFRIEIKDSTAKSGKRAVIIGLVQKGRGRLKPKYISQMVLTLRENNLLPTPVKK